VTDSNPKIAVRAALLRIMSKQTAASETAAAASLSSTDDDTASGGASSASSSRGRGKQKQSRNTAAAGESQLPMLDALVTCLTRRTEELSKLPAKYAQGLLFDMQVWAVLRKELKVGS
jgi:hypothetical protein